MRAIKLISTLAAAVVVAAGPAYSTTVDEVIAKHIEARGGDAWEDIETFEIEGSFTAFSQTQPYKMQRKRGDKLRLDTAFLDSDMHVGFDGETAWRDQGGGAQKVEGLEYSILIRDADWASPFFDYEEKGYQVKLIGDTEFEGMKAIGIELTREDELTETWYLDPKTYLEMGRTSPGTDWLGEVPRTTYYDDFREVSGVMLPFYVEAQWYTRDRVYEIASIEANVPIDDSVFEIPLPPGMGPLIGMVGKWHVAMQSRSQPGQDWQDGERTSEIKAEMGNGMLVESFETSSGVPVMRTISFDRFAEKYRVTAIDAQRAQMNIQEGAMSEDGKLIVSNVDTGTTWSGFGMTFHGRYSIFDITDEGFKAEYETSIDGGENWFLNVKATYTRAEE